MSGSAGGSASDPPAGTPATLPRAIRRGPTIRVSCECGQERSLHYGERWQCESCGRRYDTNRIPLDEYAQIVGRRRRDRVVPAVMAAATVAAAVALVILGRSVAALIVVPFAAFAWANFVRPRRRRRQEEQIANLPTWEIKAD